MNWIATLLASVVVAAAVSGIVALLTSERRLTSENVIQERKIWREHVRELAAEVYHAITSNVPNENEFWELRANLALRLNPHDAEDQQILELVAPGDAARADEFNRRISLLLKHDWERAKRDASLLLWASTKSPARMEFRDDQAGRPPNYLRWRLTGRNASTVTTPMSQSGGRIILTLFLPVGLLTFFATNHVVGFQAGPVVTWLFFSLVFCALGLYYLKLWSRLLYGIVELLFGLGITLVAINAYDAAQSREYVPIIGGGLFHRAPQGVLQLSEAQIALFGMLAAIYVLVRGFDDVRDGLRERKQSGF